MTGYGFAVFAVGFFGALSALIWALTYPEQTLLKPVPGPPSDGDRHTAPPESDDLGGSEALSPGDITARGGVVRKPATRRAVAAQDLDERTACLLIQADPAGILTSASARRDGSPRSRSWDAGRSEPVHHPGRCTSLHRTGAHPRLVRA